jgi:hypothetical protein
MSLNFNNFGLITYTGAAEKVTGSTKISDAEASGEHTHEV